MYEFTYDVSLDVRHPDMDPDDISHCMGSEPSRKARAGERITNPEGTILDSVWPETCWSLDLPHPKGMWLSDFLELVVRKLTPHKEFFAKVRSMGGQAILRVAWFTPALSGDTLGCDLLRRLGELHLDIDLHVYAPDEEEPSEE